MSIEKFSKAVVRTSVSPYNLIQDIFAQKGEQWVEDILKEDYFLAALSLASPDLLNELLRVGKEGGDPEAYSKLKQSLLKYVGRMSTRSTPFGLFSGVGVVPILEGGQTELELEEKSAHKRHFRLNTNFIVRFANEVVKLPAVMDTAKYYVNTTLYRLGEGLRLVSYTINEQKRAYDLMSIETNDYLNEILEKSRTGVTKADLLVWLIGEGIEAEEAEGYLMELINAQLLVSQLEPSTIGLEVEFQLLEGLNELRKQTKNEGALKVINKVVTYLERVIIRLDKLNQNALTYNGYKELISFVKEYLPIDLEEVEDKFLIQCNLALNFKEGTGITVAQEGLIQKAMEIVNHFQEDVQGQVTGVLGEFKEAFQKRYEDRFVPLVEALDVEVGIGYAGRKNGSSVDVDTFLDAVPLKHKYSNRDALNWDKRVLSYWYPKFLKANKENHFSVEITKEELKNFENVPTKYSATFIAKAGLYKKEGEDVVFFEAYAGGSASTWYGRFCNGNKELADLNQEIVDFEDGDTADYVVAEINHLPESRLGNVIHRGQARKYQINYLSHFNNGDSNQILIEDLMVGVRRGKLMLFSKRLNKEVRTYHSNAFNSGLPSNLPIFQFLADLNGEHNKCGASLNFSPLHKLFKFIPRIAYQNIIFQRANWSFTKVDFEKITTAPITQQIELFRVFRQEWLLPKQFVIKNADNELLIDAENEDSLAIFFEELRKKGALELSEFLLFTHDSAVKDAGGNQYNNEVLFNYKMSRVQQGGSVKYKDLTKATSQAEVTESFAPGSEWLYYKVYSGMKTADKLLMELSENLDHLIEKGILDKWFFIRYSDPGNHLRIRLRLVDLNFLGGVMLEMTRIFDQFKKVNPIERIQMDTYQRELDRYGYELTPLFEEIFYHDSRMNVNLIRHCHTYEVSNDLWLPALYSIYSLCALFELKSEEKEEFFNWVLTSFRNEFNAYSGTTKGFGKKYTDCKKRINQVFIGKDESGFNSFVKIVEERNRNIKPLIQKVLKEYENPRARMEFLNSVIHMSINRQFRGSQRMYEFMLTDFLKKITKTMQYVVDGKSKKQKSNENTSKIELTKVG